MGIPFFTGNVRTKHSDVRVSDSWPCGGGSYLVPLAAEVRTETKSGSGREADGVQCRDKLLGRADVRSVLPGQVGSQLASVGLKQELDGHLAVFCPVCSCTDRKT